MTSEERTVEPARPATVLEDVLIRGDLKALTQEQRSAYYMRVCESAGLNPLTQPFEYLTLNGKLVLYAKRSCTDQLRSVHGVSVVEMSETERDGVYIVTAKVQDKHGRTDMAKGAVNIANLKGEPLANAMMKAETKAKRRATLSICGLGLLDETEVETIPGAIQEAGGGVTALNNPRPRQHNQTSSAALKRSGAWDSFLDKVQHYKDARDLDGLKLWFCGDEVQTRISAWSTSWREAAQEEFEKAHDEIKGAE